jgi:GntR family transcriptional regulator, transcriptional repressor for pyruvate dehydrogenase complex
MSAVVSGTQHNDRPGTGRTAPMQVADELRDVILATAPGQLLGSEDELVARYGVSRPTFRQAARILQAEGLLEVRRGVGGGLFAHPPTPGSVARTLSVLLRHRHMTFPDIAGSIQALTGELARQAAAQPRANERAKVARAIRAFRRTEQMTDAEAILAAGVQFGAAVSSLAPNPVVVVLLEVLVDLLVLGGDGPDPQGHFDDLREFHEAVADAILHGDQLAVLAHCDAFRARLTRW